MNNTRILLSILIVFVLQIVAVVAVKAELDLIPISVGNSLESFLTQNDPSFSSAKLIHIVTTPYIKLTGIGDYTYRFEFDHPSYFGGASFWIATYMDSVNNDIVKSFTIYHMEGTLSYGLMAWSVPILELFQGYKFTKGYLSQTKNLQNS